MEKVFDGSVIEREEFIADFNANLQQIKAVAYVAPTYFNPKKREQGEQKRQKKKQESFNDTLRKTLLDSSSESTINYYV